MMPFTVNHMQVLLTPFGSPGNALSSFADRRQKIHEKHSGIKFNSTANLVAQIVTLYQPNKDKVTIVASMMLSLSCKPANIVSIFQINFYCHLSLVINIFLCCIDFPFVDGSWKMPSSIRRCSFFFVGKTTKSEVVNYDPWIITHAGSLLFAFPFMLVVII